MHCAIVLAAALRLGGIAPPDAAPPAGEHREVRPTAAVVNVRSEPSLAGRVLYQVHRGEVLQVLEEDRGWLLVASPGRTPGYVREDMVAASATQPAAATSSPVAPPEARGETPANPPSAAAPVIDHAPLSCIRPDQNPLVVAGVTASATIRRSRVYFKAHQYPDWYYVDMEAGSPPSFDGVLPQPLPGTLKIDYYVQAVDANLEAAQTREYDPQVTKDGCRKKAAAALARANHIVVGATKAGQAAVPPGFSAKGIVAFVTAAGATLTGADLAGGQGGGGAGGPGATAGAGAAGGAGAAAATTAPPPQKGGGGKALLIAAGAVAVGGGVALAAKGGGGGGGQTTTTTTLAPTFTLGVSTSGTGAGSVASQDGRISCPGTCSAAFPVGSAVVLTAAAASGSVFTRWSADAASCGTAAQCPLTMDAGKNVTAQFDPATSGPKKLFVQKQSLGTAGGTGTVTSGDGFINCGPGCNTAQHNYGSGAHVTLNASPSPGSTFRGFTGACGTAVQKCELTMDSDQDVTAVFFADTPTTFDVVVTLVDQGGGATGTVTSLRDGGKINCPTTCSASYAPGSSVVLAETTNNFFGGWGGDAVVCKANTTCTLTVNGPLNVIASFNLGIAAQPQVRRWTSELAVARASARVLVNGDEVVLPTSGRSEHTLHVLPRENRVEARLVQPAGAGTWRFAFEPGAIEPGSLQVQQGDVVLVTEDSVVFRLSGAANEVVAFTFRGKPAQ